MIECLSDAGYRGRGWLPGSLSAAVGRGRVPADRADRRPPDAERDELAPRLSLPKGGHRTYQFRGSNRRLTSPSSYQQHLDRGARPWLAAKETTTSRGAEKTATSGGRAPKLMAEPEPAGAASSRVTPVRSCRRSRPA